MVQLEKKIALGSSRPYRVARFALLASNIPTFVEMVGFEFPDGILLW